MSPSFCAHSILPFTVTYLCLPASEFYDLNRERLISSAFDDIVNTNNFGTAMHAYKPISADFMESIG